MQTKNKKMEYTTPMVELLEARVEKGYQNSEIEGLHNRGMEGVTSSGNNYANELFS